MNDFFEWSTFGTLTGAVAGVVVVSNTVRTLTKRDSVWIPFSVALVIVIVLGYIGGTLLSITGVVLAILNACLLFCTALGLNDTVISNSGGPGTGQGGDPHGARDVRFLQTWLQRTSA